MEFSGLVYSGIGSLYGLLAPYDPKLTEGTELPKGANLAPPPITLTAARKVQRRTTSTWVAHPSSHTEQ